MTVVDPDPGALRHALSLGCRAQSEASSVPSVDAHVVATPSDTHLDLIERLAPLGRPIFVEKPLGTDGGRARRLLSAALPPVFVMEKWRYHPGVQLLADLAHSGVLGPVVGVATRRLQWGCSASGADAVWTLLPHDLSIARVILGSFPEPRFARGERGTHGLDGIVAGLGFEPWALLQVSSRHPEYVREVCVTGAAGAAVLQGSETSEVTLRCVGEPERKVAFETRQPLADELAGFVGFLRGGPPPLVDLAEGVRAVELIETLRFFADGRH